MPNNDDIQQFKETIKLLEVEIYFKNQEIDKLNKLIKTLNGSKYKIHP
jgi:hypothetical protein